MGVILKVKQNQPREVYNIKRLSIHIYEFDLSFLLIGKWYLEPEHRRRRQCLRAHLVGEKASRGLRIGQNRLLRKLRQAVLDTARGLAKQVRVPLLCQILQKEVVCCKTKLSLKNTVLFEVTTACHDTDNLLQWTVDRLLNTKHCRMEELLNNPEYAKILNKYNSKQVMCTIFFDGNSLISRTIDLQKEIAIFMKTALVDGKFLL